MQEEFFMKRSMTYGFTKFHNYKISAKLIQDTPKCTVDRLQHACVRNSVELCHLDERVDGLADDHEHGLDDEEDAGDGDKHGGVDERRAAGVGLVGNHDPGQGPDEGRVDHEHVAGVDVDHEEVEDEEDEEHACERSEGDVHSCFAI